MTRWRVDYIGKKGSHLGMVEAADEKSATLTRRGAIRLAFRSRTDQAGFSGLPLPT